MSLCCIVYISISNQAVSELELDKLLKEARSFNAMVGVSGVLLHHEGTFFQYIEGECDGGLAIVYDRICHSAQHSGMIELLKAPIQERLFGEWYMGSSRISQETLLSLRNAKWQDLLQGVVLKDLQQNPAIALLKSQWQLIIDRDY